MKSKVLDACLTVLGMVGILVYVLACAPSFSPDGKKIAFSVVDYDTEQVSIVVYDTENKNFETVAELTNPNLEDDEIAYSVQWMPDGERLLINGTSLIMMSPFGSHGPVRTFQPEGDMSFFNVYPPPVIGDSQIIVNSDKAILYRVNLTNWDTQSFPLDYKQDDINLPFTDGKEVYFSVKLQKEDHTFFSIMKLDMEDGTHAPVAEIGPDECGDLEGVVGVLADGRFVALSEYEDRQHIVFIRNGSVEKIVKIEEIIDLNEIGRPVLSPDGRSIFTTIITNNAFCFVKIDTENGNTRVKELFEGDNMDKSQNEVAFQVALSPDGRKIAVSAVSGIEYMKLKPEDRALYLIDISSPEWEVEKIPIPLPSTSKQANVEK